jgi:DNA-3-methyladenine glycosylase II
MTCGRDVRMRSARKSTRVRCSRSQGFTLLQIALSPRTLLLYGSRFRNGANVTQTSGHFLPFDLTTACQHLAESDAALKPLIEEARPFEMDGDPLQSPYEALLEAIAYQSISGKAAATIYGRVKALSGTDRPPAPEQMLKLKTRALRKAGLSGAKVLAMKDLARKTLGGVVPTLEEAQALSDEELVERLVSVRGIGAWTVEMFLIFRLGRPDVLPIHDLGVKKGWSVTYGKKHMPKPKELLAFGERWRPYRTVASWYMWRAFERAGAKITNKIKPHKTRQKIKAAKHRKVATRRKDS